MRRNEKRDDSGDDQLEPLEKIRFLIVCNFSETRFAIFTRSKNILAHVQTLMLLQQNYYHRTVRTGLDEQHCRFVTDFWSSALGYIRLL